MDIPKKGVSMEEVIEYRALQKDRSGSEEEIGLLFFLFKYFTYTSQKILRIHVPQWLFYKQL